ncbi:MAG: acyl-CoA dehydratase activase [Spirochaetia bacterium]
MKNPEQKALGVCLGASTISAVEVSTQNGKLSVKQTIIRPHEGNPKKVFSELLEKFDYDEHNVLVTGRKFRNFVRLPNITEPEAVEYALEHISNGNKQYDAVVSAGGETFMVYRLDHNHKVAGISTGNKCASGTGEFFLQQIKRMNLGVTEAVDIASTGVPYAVSGRCSVFCKSDCTHALNKGEPIANVTAGLCKMIAQKITELLAKIPHDNILIVGGTAQNKVVIDSIKKEIPSVTVPEQAAYFEALGAAIAGLKRGEKLNGELFHEGHSGFSFLPPLKDFEHLVTFNSTPYAKAEKNDTCIIGLDVGSTTTKAVLLRTTDNSFLASVYLRTNGNPVEASRQCYEGILKQIGDTPVKIIGIGVTGSGRQIAGLYSLTDGIINEIIAHASAAVYFDPKVDTIFEIGGQDAKYTYITNSVASDYAMNEACSAGTGSFLEEAAYESLGVKVEDIADLAIQGKRPPNFNDQCAAFISSDIKNATHEDISRNDILAGLVYSICFNYINRVKGYRPVGEKIFVQGGVCYNKAVPLAMAAILRKPIVVPPEPGLMGAFGVALELKKRLELGLIEKKSFDLRSLIARKVSYDKPFTCAGGKEKCDLKCSINRIRIEDKLYPFGGACNRYYNMRFKISVDPEKLDLVKVRNELQFGKYAPPAPENATGPVIGINRSFLAHKLFPLYYNFFTDLGCRVIIPDIMNHEALDRQTSSLCYPAQIAIGFFDTLTGQKPDYYFMPHVEELYVPQGNVRKEFSSTCIFIQGEAFWMRQIYKDKDLEGRILAPTINFNEGYEKGRPAFIDTAKKLGIPKKTAHAAFTKAVSLQEAFEDECWEIGRKALEQLRATPDKIGVVVLGRAYNAFNDEANKGIPKKITTRSHLVIPADMIPIGDEPLKFPHDDYLHWEIGQQLIRVSQVVKNNPQLFGVYITNFLCAIDSLLLTYFRKIMGTKPSLTLELDGHTADAGINTRIEAFLDIIHNYLKVQKDALAAVTNGFKPARMSIENTGIFFVDSDGKRFPLKHPQVTMIIPSMGDLGNRAFAAVFQKLGVKALALPVADTEVLRLGRGVTTCKECLPMIVCVGSMLKYLEQQKSPQEKLVIFQPRAAGYCRLGQYHVYMNILIRERKLHDVAVLSLANEERYSGVGPTFALSAWEAIVVSDVMDDIRNSIKVLAKDPASAMEIFNREYDKVLDTFAGRTGHSLYRQLKLSAKRLAEIPLKMTLDQVPQVIVMGEIFVRRDSFSNQNIAGMLAERGFIARLSPVMEWIYYLNYMIKNGLHYANHTLLGALEFFISDKTQHIVERRIKKILSASGLYEPEYIDIDNIIKYSKHIVPTTLKGEPGMIMGMLMRDALNKYAGIINIGPFGCMPVRFTEAVVSNNTDMDSKIQAFGEAGERLLLEQFARNERIPFLTVECDGNPYPQLLEARFESFCLQASRVALKQGKIPGMEIRVEPSA